MSCIRITLGEVELKVKQLLIEGETLELAFQKSNVRYEFVIFTNKRLIKVGVERNKAVYITIPYKNMTTYKVEAAQPDGEKVVLHIETNRHQGRHVWEQFNSNQDILEVQRLIAKYIL